MSALVHRKTVEEQIEAVYSAKDLIERIKECEDIKIAVLAMAYRMEDKSKSLCNFINHRKMNRTENHESINIEIAEDLIDELVIAHAGTLDYNAAILRVIVKEFA